MPSRPGLSRSGKRVTDRTWRESSTVCSGVNRLDMAPTIAALVAANARTSKKPSTTKSAAWRRFRVGAAAVWPAGSATHRQRQEQLQDRDVEGEHGQCHQAAAGKP